MWQLLGVPDSKLPTCYNATLGLIRNDAGQRTVTPTRWGLVSEGMTREAADGLALFNAYSETAHQKVDFRAVWKIRHAMLPVFGWIEWRPGSREERSSRT